MGCSSFFTITIPACPPFIVINGGLEANTRYRWEITDKFGHVYNGLSDSDATGLLGIPVEDNEDIPPGLFMQWAGTFIVRANKYITQYQVEPVSFTFNGQEFEAVELSFKSIRPGNSYFDPEAPVYVLPPTTTTEQAFENQTSVTVTHNFGYKPIVQIIDTEGNLIGCNVEHGSNNEFTVTFDSSTSGTILYR